VGVDVAVVGAPFLDLTFEGLPRIPRPGEELLARRFHVAPGGTGMQAVGAARLGLSAALVARWSDDAGGRLLRAVLEAEGVELVGPGVGGTAATALLSTPDGVAMATAVGGDDPSPEAVASVAAGTVVASLGRLRMTPEGVPVYAVTGSLETAIARASLEGFGRPLHAVIANAPEARAITGIDDAAAAAYHLGRFATTAVVTLGEDGAVAATSDGRARARAPDVPVVDATGAGDLFVSAYVWADLAGAGLEDRLAWAVLYASLSVAAATAFEGALHAEPFLREGVRRGLTPP
jgi:sugar/nucleoside kinase (ribokinase family)